MDILAARRKHLNKIIVQMIEDDKDALTDLYDMHSHDTMRKYIIRLDNITYRKWRAFIGFVSLPVILLYSYFTAFSFPIDFTGFSFLTFEKSRTENSVIMVMFLLEVCFFIDIVLNFFLEFKYEETNQLERDIRKIGERYLKGEFPIDLLSIIPFPLIFKVEVVDDNYHAIWWLYSLKLLRLRKATILVNPGYIMNSIDLIFSARLRNVINRVNNGELSQDPLVDNNKILM